jgi:nitrogen regulatory protein PII
MFEPTPMDWIRDAIANAAVENMDIADLIACAEHAETVEDFNSAVNLLAQTQPGGAKVFVIHVDDLFK